MKNNFTLYISQNPIQKITTMMKAIFCIFAASVGIVLAQTGYEFSDGYLDVLGGEPNPAFTCDGRPYGYYADAAADCRIFHICLPIQDDLGEVVRTAQWSFFCGNQTIFSQESLTCSHPEEAFPCDQAESLYDASNADFGRIPDGADNSV